MPLLLNDSTQIKYIYNHTVSRSNQKYDISYYSMLCITAERAKAASACRCVSYASPHSTHVPQAAYARDLSVEINMRKWNIMKRRNSRNYTHSSCDQ